MASVVHALPYPSIDFGNRSFPKGKYSANVLSLKDRTSIEVTHDLEEAPFIDKLLQSGKAEYGCLLSVPITGYRKLNLSQKNIHKVSWDMGIVGEPPIIRPVILAIESFEHQFTKHDGVAKIWDKKKIKIPKGARLARWHYLRSESSFHSILNIFPENDLPEGSFIVSPNDDQGFKFDVRVATDVFQFLRHPHSDRYLYRSIGSHMASICFSILQNDYGFDKDDNSPLWEDHYNLQMLTGLLNERDLLHWSDENFRPEEAALNLYQLIFPSITEDE